jgi:hypothetical protein
MRVRAEDSPDRDDDLTPFEELVARCDAHIAAAHLRDVQSRLEAAKWKADRRRFSGEGPTGFGSL